MKPLAPQQPLLLAQSLQPGWDWRQPPRPCWRQPRPRPPRCCRCSKLCAACASQRGHCEEQQNHLHHRRRVHRCQHLHACELQQVGMRPSAAAPVAREARPPGCCPPPRARRRVRHAPAAPLSAACPGPPPCTAAPRGRAASSPAAPCRAAGPWGRPPRRRWRCGHWGAAQPCRPAAPPPHPPAAACGRGGAAACRGRTRGPHGTSSTGFGSQLAVRGPAPVGHHGCLGAAPGSPPGPPICAPSPGTAWAHCCQGAHYVCAAYLAGPHPHHSLPHAQVAAACPCCQARHPPRPCPPPPPHDRDRPPDHARRVLLAGTLGAHQVRLILRSSSRSACACCQPLCGPLGPPSSPGSPPPLHQAPSPHCGPAQPHRPTLVLAAQQLLRDQAGRCGCPFVQAPLPLPGPLPPHRCTPQSRSQSPARCQYQYVAAAACGTYCQDHRDD
mmetsp:Transcript_36325/g.80837  ORF Transcript_36325/g.80837 Transcript_36325/m.80837 type:complete len:442 (-) Transcript_36325:586-1911(-)